MWTGPVGPVIGFPRRARRSPWRRCRPRVSPAGNRCARDRGGAGSPGPAVHLAGSWRADRGRSRRCGSATPVRPAPQILHCPERGGRAGVAWADRPRSARPDARPRRRSRPAIPRPRSWRTPARSGPSPAPARAGPGRRATPARIEPAGGPRRRGAGALAGSQVVVGPFAQLPVDRDRAVRREPGRRDLSEDRRGLGDVDRAAPALGRAGAGAAAGTSSSEIAGTLAANRPSPAGRRGRSPKSRVGGSAAGDGRRRRGRGLPRRRAVGVVFGPVLARPGCARRLRDDGQRCRVGPVWGGAAAAGAAGRRRSSRRCARLGRAAPRTAGRRGQVAVRPVRAGRGHGPGRGPGPDVACPASAPPAPAARAVRASSVRRRVVARVGRFVVRLRRDLGSLRPAPRSPAAGRRSRLALARLGASGRASGRRVACARRRRAASGSGPRCRGRRPALSTAAPVGPGRDQATRLSAASSSRGTSAGTPLGRCRRGAPRERRGPSALQICEVPGRPSRPPAQRCRRPPRSHPARRRPDRAPASVPRGLRPCVVGTSRPAAVIGTASVGAASPTRRAVVRRRHAAASRCPSPASAALHCPAGAASAERPAWRREPRRTGLLGGRRIGDVAAVGRPPLLGGGAALQRRAGSAGGQAVEAGRPGRAAWPSGGAASVVRGTGRSGRLARCGGTPFGAGLLAAERPR